MFRDSFGNGHFAPGARPDLGRGLGALRLTSSHIGVWPAVCAGCFAEVVNQDPPKPISELYFTHQAASACKCTRMRWSIPTCGQEHVPFYPRQRILIWTNYKLLMKAWWASSLSDLSYPGNLRLQYLEDAG